MNGTETFSDLLSRGQMAPSAWVGISEAEARVLPIVQTVHSWSDKPLDYDPTWPIAGVPLPTAQNNEHEVTYVLTSAVADTHVLVVERVYACDPPVRHYTRVTAYPRTPDADYWPTKDACEGLVETWATLLEAEARTYVGRDCDTSTGASPAEHWQDAKRRYGLKHNQTCRLLFVCGLDPEGRHRCNPYLPMPSHMERALRVADGLAGVRMGVKLETIQPDDLYASGGVLPEEDILTALRAHMGAK